MVGGEYQVSVEITDPTRKLEVDLFRAFGPDAAPPQVHARPVRR
jgi:hypothetical protein